MTQYANDAAAACVCEEDSNQHGGCHGASVEYKVSKMLSETGDSIFMKQRYAGILCLNS